MTTDDRPLTDAMRECMEWLRAAGSIEVGRGLGKHGNTWRALENRGLVRCQPLSGQMDLSTPAMVTHRWKISSPDVDKREHQ